MTDDKFSTKRLTQIDPLGEIRRRAEELWREAGAPASKSWKDFWEQAEDRMLSIRNSAHANKVHAVHPSHVPEEVRTLIEQPNDIVLSVIAAALGDFIDEHEADCLGHLLRFHRLTIVDHGTVARQDILSSAKILAQLCREYPENFLPGGACGSFRDIALADREAYWQNRLNTIRRDDAPLGYADQNTIRRLKALLEQETRVQAVIFDDSVE